MKIFNPSHPLFLLLLFVTFLLSLSSPTPVFSDVKNPTFNPNQEREFKRWLQSFRKLAFKEGVPITLLDITLGNLKINQRVLKLDRKQPEFIQTFWQYLNRSVTKWRVEHGKKLLKKNGALLHEVTKTYGIPERILVALWGMETNYGGYTGNTPVIESLATLSFDPRRSTFFTKELISALKIIANGDAKLSQMNGSWAGAIGQCQFMPSNYLRYAVDADNDKKRDLWNSHKDIFYSMGNFLQSLGWKKGENWGREVKIPQIFDYSLADGNTKRPLAQWEKLGLKLANGTSLPKEDMQATLILPFDASGPAFLVFNNFFVIKRWNNSNSYALSVGHLADRIVGKPKLSKTMPKNHKPLSRLEMKEIQLILKMKGYGVKHIDGIAGKVTRHAIRAFQVDHHLTADGYPSHEVLENIRANKP